MGVKNLSGKNPKYGKNLVVGVILDQFRKMYHTFPGFFPDPPPWLDGKNPRFVERNLRFVERYPRFETKVF